MTAIVDIAAREILDSRGNPTVEVEVGGRRVAALVDSGLLHLRVGQRVSLELDDAGAAATRVWIVGIGPGETIH